MLSRPPLKIGTVVRPYGKLVAVVTGGGERSYFFVHSSGDVALIPAVVIEGMTYESRTKTRQDLGDHGK